MQPNCESSNMKIRKAKKEDAPVIAHLLLLAMRDIVYQFIGESNDEKTNQFMLRFVSSESNQYSYENCWIGELDGDIVAAVTLYDGARLHELRKPIFDFVTTELDKSFQPEDETVAGEIYIDSFGVNPVYQGKGLGTKLLQFLIQEYVEKQGLTLGLLVDNDNPNAKRLYEKIGFRVVGEKTLVGHAMEHLQIG